MSISTAYCVEYAKSNRSTCKGCKLKIDKDVLRIGTTVSGLGDYDMTSWRHLECTKKPAKLTEPSQIDGVGMLKPEDEARVYEWWTNPAVYAQKRKAEDMAAAVADARADAEPPSTPKKAKPTRPHSSTPDSNKSTSGIDGEVAKRAEYEATFGALPVPELKNCLRVNQQLLSGSKGELVERCVDRKLYGNLPRCDKCGIGRLKVTYTKPHWQRRAGHLLVPRRLR